MQQHIKTYYDKVEAVLASRSKTNKSKKSRRGLLAPSGDAASSKERDQIETIADIVEGIREAKEEILNARK